MLKVKVVLVATMIMITGISLTAQDKNTQAAQICKDLDSCKRELDEIESAVEKRYRRDSLFLKAFDRERKAWKIYCSARIALKFPEKDTKNAYGDMYPLCLCLEKIGLIRKRISELQQWSKGVADSLACPGSTLIEPDSP